MNHVLAFSGAAALTLAAFAFATPSAAHDHRQPEPSAAKEDHCGLPAGKGAITALDVAESKVTIAHEAMAAIGWPAMNMEFAAAKPVDLAAFAIGDDVHFLLAPQKGKSFRIAAMCATGSEKSAHQACMKSMHATAVKLAADSEKPCDVKMPEGAASGHENHH